MQDLALYTLFLSVQKSVLEWRACKPETPKTRMKKFTFAWSLRSGSKRVKRIKEKVEFLPFCVQYIQVKHIKVLFAVSRIYPKTLTFVDDF